MRQQYRVPLLPQGISMSRVMRDLVRTVYSLGKISHNDVGFDIGNCKIFSWTEAGVYCTYNDRAIYMFCLESEGCQLTLTGTYCPYHCSDDLFSESAGLGRGSNKNGWFHVPHHCTHVSYRLTYTSYHQAG
jgi:hypothetical protein